MIDHLFNTAYWRKPSTHHEKSSIRNQRTIDVLQGNCLQNILKYLPTEELKSTYPFSKNLVSKEWNKQATSVLRTRLIDPDALGLKTAESVIHLIATDGCKHVRFSGRSFTVYDHQVEKLVERANNIKSLSLFGFQLGKFSYNKISEKSLLAIAKLQQLEIFYLVQCAGILKPGSFSGTEGGFQKLRYLDYTGSINNSDLRNFAALPKLETLTLKDAGALNSGSFSGIEGGFQKLKYLEYTGSINNSDLRIFAEFPELEDLRLGNVKMLGLNGPPTYKLEPGSFKNTSHGFKKLKSLGIVGCLNNDDLEALSEFPKLELDKLMVINKGETYTLLEGCCLAFCGIYLNALFPDFSYTNQVRNHIKRMK